MDIPRPAVDFAAGMLATGFSTAIGYPFDTLKTREQCQRMIKGHSKFKGLRYPLLAVAPKRAAQLAVFEWLLHGETNRWYAGMACGLMAAPLNTPLHNLKSLCQIESKIPRGMELFRGFHKQCRRDMAFGCVYLGTYDWLRKKDVSPAVAGALSGGIVWTACLPLDSNLTAYQTRTTNYRIFGGWKFMMLRTLFTNAGMWYIFEKIRKWKGEWKDKS